MSAAEYRKIIAVDFDGTLAVTQFPTIIEPKWNEIAICKALKKQGCILILWTCRCGEDLTAAVEWCKEHTGSMARSNRLYVLHIHANL